MNSVRIPKALQMASVASMIDLFNAENIKILEGNGYKVDVAANFKEGSITSDERVLNYKKELQERNIGVIDTPIPRSVFKINKIWQSYKIIRKLVEENHYQIVHCHSPIGGVIARLACINARRHGTKVIYTAHGFHFYKGAPFINWVIYYPIERFCARFTDILITINQEDFKRALSFNCKDIFYLPGIGVNTQAINDVSYDRSSIRKEFGFTCDDFIFLSTGQLSKRKNHEVIIRALANVPQYNVKYLIVGDGEKRDYLENLVQELNLCNRVCFAGYRGDVNKIVHAVEAFAFPSLQEGLPVALMEAMSAGLPIICSNIRGNIDLIKHGGGGFVYECNDIKGFSEGMQKIYNLSYESIQKMKLTNMKTMEGFDIKEVNRQMDNIYNLCK